MNAKFPEARVVPLPIKAPSRSCRPALRPFRLVSIGRIDGMMKAYNFTVPPILRELRNEGCEMHWDVYGGGAKADVEKFMAVMRNSRVEDCMTWHGELPYSEMQAVLENATAFLGMGTAAIEAAMFGIPSIVSVASTSEPVCYGFLHDVPFGICGESGAYWVERRSVKSVLAGLYGIAQPEYERLVMLERDSAMRYEWSAIISRFIEFSKESRKAVVPAFPISWSLIQCLNMLRFKLFASRGGL